MPAEIEAVAVADLGLGEAADLVLGLEDDHRHALPGEQVAGGQAGGAAAEHGDGRRAVGVRRGVWTTSNSTVDMADTLSTPTRPHTRA